MVHGQWLKERGCSRRRSAKQLSVCPPYFTGADQPYERLKKALRTEVDESAWAALYQNETRPFPRSKTGQIAVKVINHYGDEVLKVFGV